MPTNGDHAREDISAVEHAHDETRLRTRIARGDVDALGDAFDRYGDLVYRLARRRSIEDGIGASAEDLTRDAFLALWVRPWQPRGSLLARLLDEVRGPRK